MNKDAVPLGVGHGHFFLVVRHTTFAVVCVIGRVVAGAAAADADSRCQHDLLQLIGLQRGQWFHYVVSFCIFFPVFPGLAMVKRVCGANRAFPIRRVVLLLFV